MMDFTILFIIAAAIAIFVSAAFEAVKVFFNIATRYLPIAAVAVGIFVALVLQPFTSFDFYTMGVAGLSACGLFDIKKHLGRVELMKVSKTCLVLVQKWEGFYINAYLCPAGVWTIGYGTTVWPNGKRVKKGDKITREEASKLLEKQVNEHASTIAHYVKVPLNQNQYDALASFQYNLGRHILKGSYLLKYLNAKQWDKAAI